MGELSKPEDHVVTVAAHVRPQATIPAVFAVIGRLRRSRAERNQHHSKDDSLVRYTQRLGWATWAIAGVGILGFVAALLQWDAMRSQLNEMQTTAFYSERAWIAPLDLRFMPIRDGDVVHIALRYINTGNLPAVDVDSHIEIHISSIVPKDYRELILPPNNMCKMMSPLFASRIDYPRQMIEDFKVVKIPMQEVAPELRDTDAYTPYVHGCIVYTSKGETHKSGFCFFTRPKHEGRSKRGSLIIAPAGTKLVVFVIDSAAIH